MSAEIKQKYFAVRVMGDIMGKWWLERYTDAEWEEFLSYQRDATQLEGKCATRATE